VVAAETQLEAPAPTGNSVARSCIATRHVERRNEVAAEADRLRLVKVGDDDRNAGCLTTGLDDEHRLASGERWEKSPAVDIDEREIFCAVLAATRQIALGAVGITAGDKNLSHVARPDQANCLGSNDERDRLADNGGLVSLFLRCPLIGRFSGRQSGRQ